MFWFDSMRSQADPAHLHGTIDSEWESTCHEQVGLFLNKLHLASTFIIKGSGKECLNQVAGHGCLFILVESMQFTRHSNRAGLSNDGNTAHLLFKSVVSPCAHPTPSKPQDLAKGSQIPQLQRPFVCIHHPLPKPPAGPSGSSVVVVLKLHGRSCQKERNQWSLSADSSATDLCAGVCHSHKIRSIGVLSCPMLLKLLRGSSTKKQSKSTCSYGCS